MISAIRRLGKLVPIKVSPKGSLSVGDLRKYIKLAREKENGNG